MGKGHVSNVEDFPKTYSQTYVKTNNNVNYVLVPSTTVIYDDVFPSSHNYFGLYANTGTIRVKIDGSYEYDYSMPSTYYNRIMTMSFLEGRWRRFEKNVNINVNVELGGPGLWFFCYLASFYEDVNEQIINRDLYRDIVKYGIMQMYYSGDIMLNAYEEKSIIIEFGCPIIICSYVGPTYLVNFENITNRQKIGDDLSVLGSLGLLASTNGKLRFQFFVGASDQLRVRIKNPLPSASTAQIVFHYFALPEIKA